MFENIRNKKIYIITLGCKVNQYESDAMMQDFIINGAIQAESDKPADIYIINTCSVTNMADKKSRQMINRMRRRNPSAIVAATGCYVQATENELVEKGIVDLIIGNNRKKDAVRIVSEYMDCGKANDYFIDINQTCEYEKLTYSMPINHTRAYIKIQDGCNNFCTYCIIPYVRGRVRSKTLSDIVNEAQFLAENGAKELIMTGISVSNYKDGENNLENVISEISKIKGIERIRMSSVEPRVITDSFLKTVSNLDNFCPHFHLSLQSACNKTLKAMNRKYTIEEYMESCEKIRKCFDRPAITTDIIVGFPGETDEDFEITYKNLQKLSLYEIHTFKYSRRKGTVADKMPDQVDERIKNLRSDRILELTAKQKKAFEESFTEPQEVLIEEIVTIDGTDYYRGHTTRYIVKDIPVSVVLSEGEPVESLINQIITY